MSDEVLTIKLTAREVDLIHQCISTNIETVKRRHDPADPMIADLIAELGELSDDLLEQRFRPEDPDLFMDPVDFAAKHDTEPTEIVEREWQLSAEAQMIQAGIDARENMKASSRATERRAAKFVPAGSVGSTKADRENFNLNGPDRKLSKSQTHDVWEKPSNDPADW